MDVEREEEARGGVGCGPCEPRAGGFVDAALLFDNLHDRPHSMDMQDAIGALLRRRSFH